MSITSQLILSLRIAFAVPLYWHYNSFELFVEIHFNGIKDVYYTLKTLFLKEIKILHFIGFLVF